MSYSFRDKPRLSERYRGKSGDEILNELKSQIDRDRKMFFEGSPNWSPMQGAGAGTFPRTGFPFDEDMMPRGRQDIRSHLDDLAQRHPEFADQLRCPPWGGEMGSPRGTWGRKRRGSGSCGDDDVHSQASGTSSTASDLTPQSADQCIQEQNEEPGPLRGRTRYSRLPQYGLRNTVDLGQQQHDSEQEKQDRAQRSWSAPPDNRTQPSAEQPQRFVSRIDINPLNPSVSGSDAQGKPPVVPKPQQQSPQQQQQTAPKPPPQGSNVRHIPIFVEGRDEPVVPKDVDAAPEQIFSPRTPQHQQPSFGYTRPSQFTSHHQFQPQQTPSASPPAAKVSSTKAKGFPQQQPQWQQQQPPDREAEHKQQKVPQQQTKPPEAPPANDPISRVQTVQRDVDELKCKVESFSGNSRNKDYAYLDEMLTRNLLKLDDVETEGKENVRQARKEVIRNIQRCISILEAKVPSPDEQNHTLPGENADEIKEDECLQIETTGEEAPQEKGASEVTMEVDNNILVESDVSKVEIAASQPSDTQDNADNAAENLASLIVEGLKEISEVTSDAKNQKTPVEILGNNAITSDAASTEETPPMEVEQDHTSVVKDSTAPCSDSVQESSVENKKVSENGIINSPSEDSDQHQEMSLSQPKDSPPTEVKHAS